jgi:acetolactate synthase regulatory subunit
MRLIPCSRMSEVGQQHRLDLVYDARSGVLVRCVLRQEQHAGFDVVDLRLGGAR